MDDSQLLQIVLKLEQIRADVFLGRVHDAKRSRVFGGLVVAQALAAAAKTVEGRTVHSLHGYFLLPGDPAEPIEYDVQRLRDGGSFATRQCVGSQRGRAIFILTSSFQRPEMGLSHAAKAPETAAPETLESLDGLLQKHGESLDPAVRAFLNRRTPFEIRPLEPHRLVDRRTSDVSGQAFWFKIRHELPDDAGLHYAALAYMSDMTLLNAALAGHGLTVFDKTIQAASLDHALWFHRAIDANDWLLYVQDSPFAGGARALVRGFIFNRDGLLIASVAQEGLIRQRLPATDA